MKTRTRNSNELLADTLLVLANNNITVKQGEPFFESKDEVFAAFSALRESASKAHLQKQELLVPGLYSDAADLLVRGMYQLAKDTLKLRFTGKQMPHCVVAVGGYGRREMAPFSDLDLLFLVDSNDNAYLETLTEAVLYPLWDSGMTVGYSVRTIQGCIDFAREDLSFWTSLLDRRQLCGELKLYEEASGAFGSALQGRYLAGSINQKWEELDQRRKKQSNTAFVLEPDVKEGVGGLRDLHTLEWSLRGRDPILEDWIEALQVQVGLSKTDVKRIHEIRQLMTTMRIGLHLIAGRKNDVVNLQVQDQLAEYFGIDQSDIESRSERLMRQYFEAARFVANLTEQLRPFFVEIPGHRRALYKLTSRTIGKHFRSSGGMISLREGVHLRDNPEIIVELVQIAVETGQRMSFHTARSVAEVCETKRQLKAKAVRSAFLKVFDSRHTGDVLSMLHQIGILPKLMREFQHLWCRMQHDAYHAYTIDVHLINCVIALDKLLAGLPDTYPAGLQQAIKQTNDLQLLKLAVFLHDVGKGYRKDHSVFGAELCESIGKRFGIDKERTRRLALLVRQHLTLSSVAQRSDIHDPAVIRSFCEEIGDIQNLNMLYVLTVCDQSGVADNLLTSWKLNLLEALYQNAYRMLSSGDSRGRWLDAAVRSRRKYISAEIREHSDLYSNKILRLTHRYFLNYNTAEVLEHAAFLNQQEGKSCVVRFVPRQDKLLELWVAGPDQRGVFAKLCGVLFSCYLNVLQTDAFVPRGESTVFNLFLLQPVDAYFVDNKAKQLTASQKLMEVFDGPLQELDIQHDQEKLETMQTLSSRRDIVRWDNHLAGDASVLEIETWDRMGLLYLIAKSIYAAGFNIGTVKIDTRGGRVFDYIHIQDNGDKCYDFDRLDDLVDTICQALNIET